MEQLHSQILAYEKMAYTWLKKKKSKGIPWQGFLIALKIQVFTEINGYFLFKKKQSTFSRCRESQGLEIVSFFVGPCWKIERREKGKKKKEKRAYPEGVPGGGGRRENGNN